MEAHEMHYSMVIRWDSRDDIYIVDVPEMLGCTTHGKTYVEAITQALDAIDTWAIDVDPADWPRPRYYDDDEEPLTPIV